MTEIAVQFLDESLHRVLFDAMPMPVFVVDADITLLEYNAAAARCLAKTNNECCSGARAMCSIVCRRCRLRGVAVGGRSVPIASCGKRCGPPSMTSRSLAPARGWKGW